MKNKKYACYWLSVTKEENKPISVHYTLMDLKDGKLVSPKGRTVNTLILGEEKIQERADRDHIVSVNNESSIEGFKIDVIMREEPEKRLYYANSKEHLVRYSETCFPDMAEAIEGALEVFDYVDIR